MNRMPNTEIAVWGLGSGVAKEAREMREEIERLGSEITAAQATSSAYKRMWEEAMDVIKRWQDRQP